MKKIFLLVVLFGLIFSLQNCASKKALTLADVEPKLSNYPESHRLGFADEEGFVKYYQIGNPQFDKFFKTAAKLDGLVIFTEAMTQDVTKQLKKYAMSKASKNALEDNIDEIVDDTPPEKYTTEQSIAIMKLAKKKDEVSGDEIEYITNTATSLGIGVYSLGKGMKEVKSLINDGTELLQNVGNCKPWKRPAATKALKGTITNLKSISKNAPETLEEMKVLADGFKALSKE